MSLKIPTSKSSTFTNKFSLGCVPFSEVEPFLNFAETLGCSRKKPLTTLVASKLHPIGPTRFVLVFAFHCWWSRYIVESCNNNPWVVAQVGFLRPTLVSFVCYLWCGMSEACTYVCFSGFSESDWMVIWGPWLDVQRGQTTALAMRSQQEEPQRGCRARSSLAQKRRQSGLLQGCTQRIGENKGCNPPEKTFFVVTL